MAGVACELPATRPPSVCTITLPKERDGADAFTGATGAIVAVGEGGPSLAICRIRLSVAGTGLPVRLTGSSASISSVFGFQVPNDAGVGLVRVSIRGAELLVE